MDDETKRDYFDHAGDDERRHTRIMSEFGDEGTDQLLDDMAHARLVEEDEINLMVDAHRSAHTSSDRLTPAEVEILTCLAHGLGYRGAAEMRTVSVETIKTHMKSVRVKLRAKNTTQAVAIAVGRGLIPNPEPGTTPHRKLR